MPGCPVPTFHCNSNRLAEHVLGKEPANKCVSSTICIYNSFLGKTFHWELKDLPVLDSYDGVRALGDDEAAKAGPNRKTWKDV